jgi:hypothetical protein
MKAKKIILLIFIILLSACGGIKKGDQTDVKILGLRGRVKSIKCSSYYAELKFGEIKKGIKSSSKEDNIYYYFNEKEVKIEEGEYGSYGAIQKKRLYKYNDKENLIQRSDFDSKDDFLGKTIYTRDNKGNLIEESKFNSKDEFVGKIIYIRDKKGNAIETNIYDSIGILNSKFKFEYDKKGRILESRYYGPDDKLWEEKYIKYDEKGRMKEEKLKIGTSIFVKDLRYENKETNDVTLMIRSKDFSIMSKTRYTYKYDKNNNWIEKISIEDEKPKTIKKRKIEYYI